MDATHVALIFIVVFIVALLLLGSRRHGPRKERSWTWRIQLGSSPSRDEFNLPGGHGADANVVASPFISAQLQGRPVSTTELSRGAGETLGQKILTQLFLPQHLLKDLEVQKLFQEGFASLQQKNFDEAIRSFRKAVTLAHHNLCQPRAKDEIEGKIAAMAHNTLATALLAKGDLDAAIFDFREGLRLDPQSGILHDGLGNALLAKGDKEGAAVEFGEAAQLDPNLAVLHNNLGRALAAKGDQQGAVNEYRRALNLNPNLADAQENFRNADCNTGQNTETV